MKSASINRLGTDPGRLLLLWLGVNKSKHTDNFTFNFEPSLHSQELWTSLLPDPLLLVDSEDEEKTPCKIINGYLKAL